MAIQDDNTILSKADLKAYHQKILPYLGGNMMMSTNVSDSYSTDEKVVGVWLDGKPLYQKTFATTVPNNDNGSGDTQISLASLNPDTIVDVVGICRGNCQVMGNYNNLNTSSANITVCWVNDRTFTDDPNKLCIRNFSRRKC